MLRQYFMALRTVGQWKNLGEDWANIVEKCHTTPAATPRRTTKASPEGPVPDASTPLTRRTSALQNPSPQWAEWYGQRTSALKKPLTEDSDTESSDDERAEADDGDKMDVDLLLMRKYVARWANKAGVHAGVCDAMTEEECVIDWTRVIAPVLEGRIKIVR